MIIHTVSSYEEDLNLLRSLLYKMGEHLIELLHLLNVTIESNGQINFVEAINIDQKINDLDIEIEEKAVSLIALRQPMSIDLRHIIFALRAAVIIERMGDLTKNVIKRIVKSVNLYETQVNENLVLILAILKKMLSDTLQAYQELNEKKAMQICINDQQVDDLYKLLLQQIQHKLINNETNVESTVQALFAVKNLERIGDYISKIAQMVPYIVKGTKITKQEIKICSTKDIAI